MPTHRGAPVCCCPGSDTCTFDRGHTPQCDPQRCRTTGPDTQHLNFGPPSGISLRGMHTRGSPSTIGSCSTKPECPVQHGVRHVDKRETRAGRGRAGDSAESLCCLSGSRSAVCLGVTLLFVCPTPPAPPIAPGCYHSAAEAVLVLAKGSRAAPRGFSRVEMQKHRWKLLEKPQGLSAGDPNSALNFKCHCTKSGDTGWGVNWPSH